MKTLYAFSAIIMLSAAAFSATHYVPSVPCPTIQAAIIVAANGDDVVVAPGTYFENIDYMGKDLVIHSSAGWHATVIDGMQNGSVVVFSGGETSNAVLEGFTIRNGNGTLEPTGQRYGGGIYCKNQSFPQIVHNKIFGNSADYGGGVHCDGGASPHLEYNVIMENKAVRGGGVASYDTSAPFLRSCEIIYNIGTSFGGGMRCYDNSSPTLMNCIIAHNEGPVRGGGICCDNGSDAVLEYCTVADNKASSRGGGVDCNSANVTFTDCIVWDNAPDQIGLGGSGTAIVTFSDVMGGWAGAGNINANPLFVDPAGGDYHLTWSSPCRNAGNNLTPPTVDYEDDPRIAYGQSDMGADEFYLHLYYTGNMSPGGAIQGKIVSTPGSGPMGIWFGSGVLDPPMGSPFGPWYLMMPWISIYLPLTSPASGVLVLNSSLPAIPGPYAVPMQAIVVDGAPTATNLSVIYVP